MLFTLVKFSWKKKKSKIGPDNLHYHTTILVKLTRQQFSRSFLSPFLNIGVIFASFHEDGTVPVLYEFWNFIDKNGAMVWTNSASILE